MKIIHEKKRGCGYRKQGGLYFFKSGGGTDCGRLPIPLTQCPCCSAGIKFSRGFQWIRWDLLTMEPCDTDGCAQCPLSDQRIKKLDRVGLMWVGEKYYPTPADFIREGDMQGISKRIASVPNDFKVGETWIALAHGKAIVTSGIESVSYSPGIFQLFKPEEIQYVLKGDETPEQIESLEKRGITPVKIEYEDKVEQSEFEFSNSTED